MSGVIEAPQSEDRALLHLVAETDDGIKGIVLDLIRTSDGKFQNAPRAIRRLMEDLLLGMKLNGVPDPEIERRFDLGRGGVALLERALLRHDRPDRPGHATHVQHASHAPPMQHATTRTPPP